MPASPSRRTAACLAPPSSSPPASRRRPRAGRYWWRTRCAVCAVARDSSSRTAGSSWRRGSRTQSGCSRFAGRRAPVAETLPEGTVTVLFTDVEGSTGLTRSRGDEAARAALRAHEKLVRQQVEEHGGHEVKALGDGFMVAFGSARKAVACAAGIQRALAEWNAFLPAHPEPVEGRAERQDPAHPSRASGRAGGGAGGSPEPIRVRIGLNTGEVVREQDDLFGETVNAAARIAAKAKGGQVLISEATKGVL